MIAQDLRSAAADESGITVVEFGIVAPVFAVLLMGLMDLSHTAYTQSVLNGAVQEAARAASLEGGNPATVDATVTQMVQRIAPNASVTTSRESYFDYADIDRPESWDDADDSGECDNGESYVDENNNDQWDADIGATGNGGASDVVIYTVNISYERPFAMPLLPGAAQQNMSIRALRKNQPFAQQAPYNNTGGGTCD